MIAVAMLVAATAADPLAGAWEGTSTCQVRASACHDEQALYRFTPLKPSGYRLDAYKLVAGQQLLMGSADARFDSRTGEISAPLMAGGKLRGRLQLTLQGIRLGGRMTLPDGTLYRLIELLKQ